MPASRTNFRAGDRVRGAEWFDEIAGAVGTVVEAVEVRGNDWAAQDLLVRFDRPVAIFDEPQWTFLHSAHNFEYIQDTRTAPGIHESPFRSPDHAAAPDLQAASAASLPRLSVFGVRMHLCGRRGRRARGCRATALRALQRHAAPFVSNVLEMQRASEFPRGVVAIAARARDK